jgi:hypothetical protein
MCLPEKIPAKLKTTETMETAWLRLDAWFGDRGLFIKDLMQDIKNVTPNKDGEDKRLMDYYVQSHIAGGSQRGTHGDVADPSQCGDDGAPAPWEKRVWREAQGRLPAGDRAWYMEEFVEDRLAYATNMVATSERHVLSKPIPLHRSQRSPFLEGRGGRYGRGNSTGRNARVMTITESRSADRKKVRFPPLKTWDPEAK